MFSFFKPKNKDAYDDNARTNNTSSEGFVDAVEEKASEIAETASDAFENARDNIEKGTNELFNSSKKDDESVSEDADENQEKQVNTADEIKQKASEGKDAFEDGAAQALARLRGDFAPEADVVADAKADEEARQKEDQGHDEDNDDVATDVDLEGEDIASEDEAYTAGEDAKDAPDAGVEADVDTTEAEDTAVAAANMDAEGAVVAADMNTEGAVVADADTDTEVDADADDADVDLHAAYAADADADAATADVPEEDNPFAHEDVDNEALVFDEQDVIDTDENYAPDEYMENNGVSEYEPSTEERGDENTPPSDEDFGFIDSDEAYDSDVDGEKKIDDDAEDVSDDDVIDAAFINAEQGNGSVAVIIDGIDDDAADEDGGDLESYLAPLDDGEDAGNDDAEELSEDAPNAVQDDAATVDAVQDEAPIVDGENNSTDTLRSALEGDDQEIDAVNGATVDVTPIVFSDCEDQDDFTRRIKETLDNREVFVFDFTENKSGYNALPDTVKPQFVDLPDGEVSPVDARTVLQAAYNHPGSAIVVVGPEVIAEEVVSRFEPGTQAYAIIVETVAKLLREAGDNDVEVVTIGATSNVLMDDIIAFTF